MKLSIIQGKVVKSTRVVHRTGYLDPLTMAGTIVTNNITTSCCEDLITTILFDNLYYYVDQMPLSPTTWQILLSYLLDCCLVCYWRTRYLRTKRAPGHMSPWSRTLQGKYFSIHITCIYKNSLSGSLVLVKKRNRKKKV